MHISEILQTKVNKCYDIAVCGGGFAGISAALAAARMGKKVILLEKLYMLGGLGTAGLITIYLPICDGIGHQVSFGIAEELLRLSVKDGAEADYPGNWLDADGPCTENDKRFMVRYNPQVFAILVEQLLKKEGVDILYGTYVVGVQKKEDKLTHVIVENKSGRCAYEIQSVVDATGDCDIAWFANAPTDTFQYGNVLASWYYSVGKNGYRLHSRGAADISDEERQRLIEAQTEFELSDRKFAGLEAEERSEMVCLSHESLYENWKEKRETDATIWPVTMPTMPLVRMTRKIVGEYVLGKEEMHTYFEDSVGMIGDWRKRGPAYEVPFRTLYSVKVKNLICAGRCTSVTEPMWDLMRVSPCCAVTGQAAGTAAALTDSFTELDIKKLQGQLEKAGVVLHRYWK